MGFKRVDVVSFLDTQSEIELGVLRDAGRFVIARIHVLYDESLEEEYYEANLGDVPEFSLEQFFDLLQTVRKESEALRLFELPFLKEKLQLPYWLPVSPGLLNEKHRTAQQNLQKELGEPANPGNLLDSAKAQAESGLLVTSDCRIQWKEEKLQFFSSAGASVATFSASELLKLYLMLLSDAQSGERLRALCPDKSFRGTLQNLIQCWDLTEDKAPVAIAPATLEPAPSTVVAPKPAAAALLAPPKMLITRDYSTPAGVDIIEHFDRCVEELLNAAGL